MSNVILYSTGCPKCRVLKMKLDRAGVSYTVEEDVEAMRKLGLLSAPALSVDGTLMLFGDAVKWADGRKE